MVDIPDIIRVGLRPHYLHQCNILSHRFPGFSGTSWWLSSLGHIPSVCAPSPGTSAWLPSSSLWKTSQECCWAPTCGFGTHNHQSTKCTPNAPFAQTGNQWHRMQTNVWLVVKSQHFQSGAEEESFQIHADNHGLVIHIIFALHFCHTGLFLFKKVIFPLTIWQVASLEGVAASGRRAFLHLQQ